MQAIQERAAAALDFMMGVYGGIAGTPFTLNIYSGTRPAHCDGSPMGSVLATIYMPGGGSGGANWFSTNTTTLIATGAGLPWSATASATGTAAFWRICKSDGTCLFQGSVSVSGGGGELILGSLSITSGETITISSFNLDISALY